jgi:hypothetical protein
MMLLNNLKRIERVLSTCKRKLDRTDKFVFMHIPKCAGTSLYHSLDRAYSYFWNGYISGPASRQDLVELTSGCLERTHTSESLIYGLRQRELMQRARNGCRIIAGHVPISDVIYNKLNEQYRFITVIRDPVARWKSAWSFRYFINHLPKRTMEVEGAGLDAMLDQYMTTDDVEMESTIFVDFFAGRGFRESLDSYGTAILNAQNFDLIGDVCAYDPFINQFSQMLKLNLVANQANQTRRKSTSPFMYDYAQVMECLDRRESEIEKLCIRDIEFSNEIRGRVTS